MRLKALDSYFTFLHFVSICEHLTSICEHVSYKHFKNTWENAIFSQKMYFTSMLADARKMLADAHKVQKCKVWIKGFQTHNFALNFACILDKNSSKYVEFNLRAFFAFLQNWKFCAKKNAKMMKFHWFSNLNFSAKFHRNDMVNCAFESPWFILCIFALCEHLRALASIYGHIYETNENAIYHEIFFFVIRKCSCLLRKCSKMLTKCKNVKYDTRAFQRISNRINWIKSRWERGCWI